MSGVLVLNYDYTPLNITTIRRGFVLVDKGKAELIINTVLESSKQLNRSALKRQKYNLIM